MDGFKIKNEITKDNKNILDIEINTKFEIQKKIIVKWLEELISKI